MCASVLVLAAAGCGGENAATPAAASVRETSPTPSPADSNASKNILSVLTVEHEVDVRAQREGLVQQINVEEGQKVTTGEVLARLDDRSLAMELEKARADLLVAQNNVKSKEAEKQAKEANLRRQKLMRDAGLSSEADLEEAQFEATAVGYEVDSWKALVNSSQAQIQSLKIDVEQTQFRAPFPGVVLRRYLRQGQNVAKDDPGFRVSQLEPLQVHVQVPEATGGKPRIGIGTQIFAVVEPEHSYSARIIKVSPTVDPASDSYDVTMQLSGPGLSALSPGMAVRVAWPPGAAAPKP
jgi:RND family efflux transporter MFP subunit